MCIRQESKVMSILRMVVGLLISKKSLETWIRSRAFHEKLVLIRGTQDRSIFLKATNRQRDAQSAVASHITSHHATSYDSTVQYSTVQYRTVQYSTVQQCAI